MKKLSGFVALLFLGQTAIGFAGEATSLQVFVTVKKVFPEATEIAILISDEFWQKSKDKITRDLAISQIKGRAYVAGSSRQIGGFINGIANNTVLVIFGSEFLLEKSTILYILSKCKEKQIAIVTNAKAYSDAGALLGLISNDDQKIELFVNLKHSEHLRSKFTEALIQELGVQTVIQ